MNFKIEQSTLSVTLFEIGTHCVTVTVCERFTDQHLDTDCCFSHSTFEICTLCVSVQEVTYTRVWTRLLNIRIASPNGFNVLSQ